jgi:ubiquinone/menaquinone biosynthesis C-methylase UbiE
MDEMKSDEEHWTRVADQWIAWARSPSHDAFWVYREGLTRFIGSGSGHALEVGCGEGRVSRELKALGYHVTATDVVPAMVEAARQANSADDYRIAGTDRLPFDDGQFDLVMAYNVLMDVDDVPAALKEIRRVMKPGSTCSFRSSIRSGTAGALRERRPTRLSWSTAAILAANISMAKKNAMA